MKRPRRPRSMTPEERATVLNEQGYMASGTSYISVVDRDYRSRGKIPYYRDSSKCDHGISMCATWECIESWSIDYRVLLHNTVAGRELAAELNIDPVKFATTERHGIEHWNIEDFRPAV